MQTLVQKQKNLFTVAMVAALSVGSPRTHAREKDQGSNSAKALLSQLQLAVEVPPHWRPFLSDDLAEAFASRLTKVFRQNGYGGRISFLSHPTRATDSPVLAIHLLNWRATGAEHAECTFTAAVKSRNGTHELGLFENTSVARHDHGGFALALGDVADGALLSLSRKLANDGLLPGFRVVQS